MLHDDFADATLVLLGHGSTKNAGSSLPIHLHAAELRRRRIFADVREAFWKQDPKVVEVVKGLSTPRVFIVPLFISEGYFASDVIPRALGFQPGLSTLNTSAFASGYGATAPKRSEGGQLSTVHYCAPIGTHERMAEVLLSRARGIVEKFPFPQMPKAKDTTLFIAGHGTPQNKDSRKAIESQAARIGERKEYADVRAVFLEEEPRIADCAALAATKHIIVVPFFTSDGMHTQEDIPVLLGEAKKTVHERLAAGQPPWRNPTEKNGRLIWYAPAVGTAPEIAEVILERVREAAAA